VIISRSKERRDFLLGFYIYNKSINNYVHIILRSALFKDLGKKEIKEHKDILFLYINGIIYYLSWSLLMV